MEKMRIVNRIGRILDVELSDVMCFEMLDFTVLFFMITKMITDGQSYSLRKYAFSRSRLFTSSLFLVADYRPCVEKESEAHQDGVITP